MNPRHTLACALLAAALVVPSAAAAKISKELKAELEGYVTPLKGESDTTVQQAVFLTRAILEGKSAAKDFEAGTKNDDKRVRIAAGLAWYLSGDKKALDFVRTELASDANLLDTLGELVALLDDKSEAKLVADVWKSATPDVKSTLARYMAAQHGPLFTTLADYALGKDDGDRSTAIQAMVYANSADAIAPLQKLLKDKAEARRVQAIQALVALSRSDRHEGAIRPILVGQLKDAATRTAAATRLLELRDPDATPVVLDLIKAAKESSTRQEWMQALLDAGVRLDLKQVEAYLGAEDAQEKRLAHQLAAATRTPEFVERLIQMEQSTEFSDRLLAIDALGFTGSAQAAPVLSRTLFEGRTEVRLATAHGLVRLGREEAFPALEKALKGEQNAEVKLLVIQAIGAIKTPKSLQALRFMVTNNDVKIKEATLRAIRNIGLPEGAQTLDVLLRDRSTEIQWLAFLTAMELKPELGMKNIKTALRNPPESYLDDIRGIRGTNAQRQVLEYLMTQTVGSTQTDAIKSAIRHGGFDETLHKIVLDPASSAGDRRAILYYLVHAGGPAAGAILERVARAKDSKPIAALATWLLLRNPDTNLEPSLRGNVGQKDPAIRAMAVYGIAAIHR